MNTKEKSEKREPPASKSENELTPAELEKVTGGTCATGQHFKEVTITSRKG